MKRSRYFVSDRSSARPNPDQLKSGYRPDLDSPKSFSPRVMDISNAPNETAIEDNLQADSESLVSDPSFYSGDEDSNSRVSHQPYTELLQALDADRRRKEPLSKKRKLPESGSSKEVRNLKKGVFQWRDGEPDHDGSKSEDSDDDAVTSDSENDTGGDPFERHLSDSNLDTLNRLIETSSLRWHKKLIKPAAGWKSLTYNPHKPFSAVNIDSLSQGLKGELYLKHKLSHANILQSHGSGDLDVFLTRQIFNYNDVLFVDRTVDKAPFLRKVYCLHALNHILKTRDTVIKNNAKISKANEGDDSEYRDQGFTRPKVLILLPTRQACVRTIETIISTLQPEQQENRRRFLDVFSLPDDLAESDKPRDFKELFSGNDDDKFMIGVKVTRKTLKFFSNFYSSDIILASPLGLHTKITTNESKNRDWDFLSSIEIVAIDQADALMAQNWDNIETIITHLNLEPKEAHDCDFARVRRWYLDKRARYYRQTLVFSAFNTPELNNLCERHMLNVSGKVKISPDGYPGMLTQLSTHIKQTFMRFDAASPGVEPDNRFHHFTASINPLLSKYSRQGGDLLAGTLIFVPSYMDFLRIQNFFCYSSEAKAVTFNPADLPCISEYAKKSQNARAKSLFQSGRHPVLLYSGRAHHFYRYKLAGVRRVIMYSLPDNPTFYRELVGDFIARSIAEGRCSPDDVSAHVLFSKYDALKLERIVGAKRCPALLQDKGDMFEFV